MGCQAEHIKSGPCEWPAWKTVENDKSIVTYAVMCERLNAKDVGMNSSNGACGLSFDDEDLQEGKDRDEYRFVSVTGEQLGFEGYVRPNVLREAACAHGLEVPSIRAILFLLNRFEKSDNAAEGFRLIVGSDDRGDGTEETYTILHDGSAPCLIQAFMEDDDDAWDSYCSWIFLLPVRVEKEVITS